MFQLVLLVSLISLFLTEFVASLIAHSLMLRFDMCHTLILAGVTLAQVCKRRKTEHYEAERLITFWLTVCYVAMSALCAVHVIHSLQLLSLISHLHHHELDIHYPMAILFIGGVSLVIKFFCAFYVDSGFSETYISDAMKSVFHFASPLLVILVAIVRLCTNSLVWFDPTVSITCNLVTFGCLIIPMKEHIFILLLAVPKTVDVEQMKFSFEKQFPTLTCTNLTVWRESKSRINVNVHVSLSRFCNYSSTCSNIETFFQQNGADHVCIEPKFL